MNVTQSNGDTNNANGKSEQEALVADAKTDAVIEAATITYSLTDPVWAPAKWILEQARRKYIGMDKARLHVSALTSFMKVPLDTIPTVEWLLDEENINGVMGQWRNQEHKSNNTPATYKTRILWLLKEYKARCTESNFNAATRWMDLKKSDGTPKKARTSKPVEAPEAEATAAPTAAAPPPLSANTLQIIIGPQQVVRIDLPCSPSELKIEQLANIVLTLAGHVPYEVAAVKSLVGRLASHATDYSFDKGLCDQLFAKPTQ